MGEQLIDHSGKMMALDVLLIELFKRKHRVLLFSQFRTMLGITEVKSRSRLSIINPLTNCCMVRTGPLRSRAGSSVVSTERRHLSNDAIE
jgi:hypothetical protein